MKIIHLVLGKANPERMNGVNKLVHEMLTTQQALGMPVELWGITADPSHNYPTRNYTTRLFQNAKHKLGLPTQLRAALDQLEGDCVFHLHGGFIPEFYWVGKYLKRKKIGYCYTPHGALAPGAMQRRAWKKRLYFWGFEKSLIENASVIIATGQSVYDQVDRLARVQRKALIPNGQPPIPQVAPFAPLSEVFTFGFCGRIALEHKGLDLLLQGFRLFLDQGGKAEIHFIGDGKEMPQLQQIAQALDLMPHLKFYGARYGEEKFAILQTFHCFVHTSRMEGFPASVLEAAASALPCVVSTHTNVDRYMKQFKAGLVIESNTPEGIAAQLLLAWQLHQQGSLAELGANGKAMIADHFTWQKVCNRLYKEYRQAIPEKVAPSV